jgi:hypothetical protein
VVKDYEAETKSGMWICACFIETGLLWRTTKMDNSWEVNSIEIITVDAVITRSVHIMSMSDLTHQNILIVNI